MFVNNATTSIDTKTAFFYPIFLIRNTEGSFTNKSSRNDVLNNALALISSVIQATEDESDARC